MRVVVEVAVAMALVEVRVAIRCWEEIEEMLLLRVLRLELCAETKDEAERKAVTADAT